MTTNNPPSTRPMTLRQQLTPKQLRRLQHADKTLFGGNREVAIRRDGGKCVKCGMTRVEHKERYGRDITVDHIDRMGSNVKRALKNNALDNLQTLCFLCHAYKDQRNVVGTNNAAAKLTEQDVLDIRMFIAKGINLVDISRVYPVTLGTVCNIRAGRIWKHLL